MLDDEDLLLPLLAGILTFLFHTVHMYHVLRGTIWWLIYVHMFVRYANCVCVRERKREKMGGGVDEISKLPLVSLNHVSFVCSSVTESVRFYEDVMGFVLIRRPSPFNFKGAWLFNYGIGIHLLESTENCPVKKGRINPKDNHISFQCSDMELVMQKLEEMNIKYVTAVVEEGSVRVDQLFFHDPDGYMIEICNCQNLPLLPISSCLPNPDPKREFQIQCSGEAALAALMMDNLVAEMMNISI